MIARPLPWRQGLETTSVGRFALAGLAALAVGAIIAIPPLEISAAVAMVIIAVVATMVRPEAGAAILLAIVPFSGALKLPLGDLDLAPTEPLFALLLVSWGMRSSVRHQLMLPSGRVLAPVLALLALTIASAAAAANVAYTAKEVVKWVEILLISSFVAINFRSQRTTVALLSIMFVAASVEALYGMYQFVTGTGPVFFAIGPFMRAHGHFGQPNPYAGYLATVIPLAIVVACSAQQRWARLLALTCVALAGTATLMSLSRGAWLGLALALAIMLLIWRPDTGRLLAGLSVVGVTVTVLGSVNLLPPFIADRLAPVVEYFGVFDVRGLRPTPENFALLERLAHWQAGWDMFVDHPWLGIGAGNYPARYPEYALPGWPESLGHAHNYYVNIAAEEGILAVATLIWILASLVARLRVVIQRAAGWPRGLALGLLGSTIVFAVHSMFDNLLVNSMAVQLGTILGLAATLESGRGLDAG